MRYVEDALDQRASSNCKLVDHRNYASRSPKTLTFLTRSSQGSADRKETASVEYSAEFTLKFSVQEPPRRSPNVDPMYLDYTFTLAIPAGYSSGVWKYGEPRITTAVGRMSPDMEELYRRIEETASEPKEDYEKEAIKLSKETRSLLDQTLREDMKISALEKCEELALNKLWYQELASELRPAR